MAALALDVPYRWLDTILARHDVAGVTGESQGVRRSVAPEALAVLAIARDLHDHLGLPIGRALDAAHRVLATGQVRAGHITLSIARAPLEASLAAAAAEAVERVVPRRRGRPPKRPAT